AFAITLPATRLYDAPTIRRLAALIAEGAGDAAAPPPEPIPAPPPSPSPGGDVLARLNALLAETLYLEAGAIDPDQPFTEIGLDSILAVELARRIEGEFGVALRATRLYDQPTPRGLAAALAAELGAAAPPPVATAPTAPAVPDDPILARLRDKVAAMLSLDPGHVETDLGLVEFGLDRYAAGELARFVTAELGVAMDEAALFRADGLAALARQIAVAGTRPRAAPAPAAPADSRAVAVIGMAGRFPGAPDLDTFWRNLRDGVDSVTEVPPGRFAIDEWYDPDPQTPNRTYCRHGGFLTGVEDFDPRFFGISPAEARIIDPQQRLFLEAAWHALEDAGLPDHALDGAACAVFVGCSAGDYAQRAATRVSAQFGMGNVGSILAARIAYHLNLRGPAVAVDTACSSSLVAVHLACQSLASGECDVAIAGGVALMTTPAMHLLTCQARMLSPEGRCKTFDASADGFVPAEGVGAVVLKPLARALADGDRILGVVEATGTNQDGRSNGLTAPSLAAQRALESGVWERHGIDPASLGYVEAHGTGTKLGDPIELQALTDAFRRSSDAVGTCAIGSVKTNIGHAVPAAGVAGLIKTLLQLRHRTIAPSLHLVTPNPQIDLATSPFRVPRRAEPWAAPATGGPRRAAVNSFGFSGTNAHVVVAEAPERPAPPAAGGPFLFLLSGKTPDALRQRRAELRAWLEAASPDPHDLAHTLAAGRSHFRHRAAFVAGDIAELAAALAADDRAEAAPHGDEAGGMAALAAAGDAAGRRAALELLARAYRGGASLRGLYPRGSARLLAAPLYPFQRQRCWIDEAPGESKPAETGHTDTARHLGAADPLLAQHVVQGRALLPAAASLEMLLEAGPGALADIRWLRPAVADATGLTLAVEAEGDGLALLAGGARHAVARRAGVGESPPRLDLAALRADLRQPVAPDALYGRLARLGIAYGPAFRCVTALRRADDGSALLADLAPAVPGGAFLVDAALHAIAGLTDASDADGAVPLPTAMARAVAHGKLSDIRHAHVRRVGAGAFDATLTDGEGRVLLVIEGFAAERPAAGAPGAAGALAFYRSHWDRAKPTVIAPARPALLLHGIGSEALAAAVAALPGGAPCRVLALGDPAVAAAVTALPSDSHVVLLGGTSTDTDEIAAVMRSLQALILADRPARVTVVSRSATEAGVPPPNWRGAALLGLAKVAMREARRLAIATIDVGNDDCPSTAAAIAAEPAQRPGPRDAAADVAWRDGRMTRILDRVPAPGAATGIRDGGVYVIVGGGRGIGAALAHRLAAAHRARLVLVGRSPASSASDGLCAELAAAGGDAVYLAADCADVVAMAAVRDAAVARFGAVHGVVHSAFVMADGALPAMSVDRLAAALRPKLDGTAAIAEAFA
ncbi:MAG: SDR family NAD(P)-dependent oxidoreductase, partial [Alphaproteobacteria bacterium]